MGHYNFKFAQYDKTPQKYTRLRDKNYKSSDVAFHWQDNNLHDNNNKKIGNNMKLKNNLKYAFTTNYSQKFW